MKLKTALAPAIALVATVIVADDATPEVALPELPSAPILQPARPAAPAKKTTPAKPAQTAKPVPAKTTPPKPATAEIDLSASKVLSAETEDGKPVYVVFQKEESELFFLRENQGGGWIGNTYVKVGGGVLNHVGSKLAKPQDCSGSYIDIDASLSLTRWLSFRFVGLSLINSKVEGDCWDCEEQAYVRFGDNSEFEYSSLQPMLVVSANRNGTFNPYAGIGFIVQSAKINNCEWIAGWPPTRFVKSEDIDGNCSFFAPTIGLEINANRFHLSGECIFPVGAENEKLNPFGPGDHHNEAIYGGRAFIGIDVTENISLFANATMTQAFHIFGGCIGWRF